jgi:AcrR family transcriptional regulator
MNDQGAVGLRERKRAETRALLERSAVEIALRDGLEGATIDAISAAANVSSRTFFNYFDTKEDAILGLRDPHITAELIGEIERRHREDPPLEALIGMLFDIFESAAPDFSLHDARKAIVHRYPHLLAGQVAQFSRMSERLVEGAKVVLHTDDAAVAEVALGLCGSAFRVVVKEWMENDGGEIDRSKIERRAIGLAREARGELV